MRTKRTIRNDEQIEREIEKSTSKFSQYLMSNSKWVRLINKLVENSERVLKIEFKKVQHTLIGELYLDQDTAFGFDYWQNGFEGNSSLGGWLMFKEIEYLFFPKVADLVKHVEQDLEQIEALINSVGKFSLETDVRGLKVVCYRV